MLNTSTEGKKPKNSDPRIFAYLFLALSVGLLFSAVALGRWVGKHPFVARTATGMNDPKPILFASLVATVCLVAFFARFFRGRLSFVPRGSSDPIPEGWHIPIYGFYLGLPTAIFFYAMGFTFNQLADYSEPRTFQTKVLAKGKTSTKTGWSYHLIVKDWRNPFDIVRIEVKKHEYDAVNSGTPVRVVTKSGALGYEWIISRSIGAR